jgi:hypothetical protein
MRISVQKTDTRVMMSVFFCVKFGLTEKVTVLYVTLFSIYFLQLVLHRTHPTKTELC